MAPVNPDLEQEPDDEMEDATYGEDADMEDDLSEPSTEDFFEDDLEDLSLDETADSTDE